MYKYLLCWRYLRTRYIALASIISVMLGVATMIVVNSVMAGFAKKMRSRLHGVLADVVVESFSLDGFDNPDEVMALIRQKAGNKVEAVAPAIETFGILTMFYNGYTIPRQVQIIAVDPVQWAKTGDFAKFLVDEKERPRPPSFEVSEALRLRSPAGRRLLDAAPDDPFRDVLKQDMMAQVPPQGTIIGWAAASVHNPDTNKDIFVAPTGSRVILSFVSAGPKPVPRHDDFTVVGFFKSGMSENDSTHIYIPLARFQALRGMGDGHGRGAVNQVRIKVKPGVDLDELARTLRLALLKKWGPHFQVQTWEQKQGPLLAAVAVEQGILNILLFFIIAVAGFGILAIFSMIVVEKTRDIGILKALGASTAGVRGIFLAYGLLLGLVGSGVGMAGGLVFVRYINPIEHGLSVLMGHKVFDDSIYYFKEIPTLVNPFTVAWIVGGALAIAVVASVWPAQRAAKLHPVRALRFE